MSGDAAADAFARKLDLFMRTHVCPVLAPASLHWWLSLSGGKDSFAMAVGLRAWYRERRLPLSASGFTIDQWGGPAHRAIAAQLDWLPVEVLDARALTQARTGYRAGQQAPCRSCADARRDVTDELLARRARPGAIQVIARGLHLSDTAISLAWRHARGRDAARDLIDAGKARPLTPLGPGVLLAKPLSYVREHEAAQYARAAGHRHACCGCPACSSPSRRDIVEESLARFYDDGLWELSVPGMPALLAHFGVPAPALARASAPGHVAKHGHLPAGFASATVARFRALAPPPLPWDRARDLDALGAARLRGAPLVDGDRLPIPALFADRPLEPREEMMIATMGPWWGALALSPPAAARAWEQQRQLAGVVCDDRWTQVQPLLEAHHAASRPRPGARRLPISAGSSTCEVVP